MSVREITGPTEGTEDSRSSFSARLHEPADALLDARIGAFLALPFGPDHLDDLAPAGDEIGELLGGFIGQRPRDDAGCFAEVGDHVGIDRIGLGALADGRGEGADLRRVGDCVRKAGPCEGRNDDGLEATGGLEHDEVGFQHLETGYEVLKPGAGARDGKTLTTWTQATSRRSFDTSIPQVTVIAPTSGPRSPSDTAGMDRRTAQSPRIA
jgi:hypothetical protein